MTIDAQHWVWNESRSRGNVRLVLLAVADKIQTADCTVRMGTTELRKRLNAGKSVVVPAVDKALASGELKIVEEAIGSRAALYQMPLAVGYVRPMAGSRGPDSGPVAVRQGSGIETPNPEQGSGIRTGSEIARGPESVPGGSGIETPMGPESGPLNQTTQTKPVVESWETATPAERIPDVVRPLVDGMSRSGLTVRWPFQGPEWFKIHALMKRSGVPALIEYAHRAATGARTPVVSARYFLAGWQELPPLPAPDDSVTPLARPNLRAVGNGWPVPDRQQQASDDMFDRAMERAKTRMQEDR
ncbi:hypothetical protein [Streptomyces decoyicus]